MPMNRLLPISCQKRATYRSFSLSMVRNPAGVGFAGHRSPLTMLSVCSSATETMG
jgi:hypothetical protein